MEASLSSFVENNVGKENAIFFIGKWFVNGKLEANESGFVG